MKAVRFKKLREAAVIPARSREGDAGFDLVAVESAFVSDNDYQVVATGIAVAIPAGTVGLVCPRSGLAANHGLTVLNAPGVIDANFRGELKVILQNTSNTSYYVMPGDRIAQLVVVPLADVYGMGVNELDETNRGEAGFGSSGQ